MVRILTFLLILLNLGSVAPAEAATPVDWCARALSWIARGGKPKTERARPDVNVGGEVTSAPEAPASSAAGLSLRFDATQDRLKFLLGVLRQHPNLVTSNLSFRRSLLGTLSSISELQTRLGRDAASMDVTPPHFVRAKYYPSGDFRYDEPRIAEFLERRAQELDGLGLIPSGDLSAQLIHINESSKKPDGSFDEKLYKKRTTRLLRLLPFLFDSQGEAKFTDLSQHSELDRMKQEIKSSSPQELSNHYGDLLKEHLAKTIESVSQLKLPNGKSAGMGQLKQWFENTKKEFVGKEVRQILTPLSSTGEQLAPRGLVLERLPSSVALFRGCYGGDCSILSVPYYPMIKEARTYFLRKGEDINSEPSGYIFSVLVDVNGKKVPYILTANGVTLTKSDVEMAARMVAEDWGTTEIVLPDLEKNPNLVNTTDAREGLKAQGGKKVAVTLPKSWSVVEKYTNENPAKDLNGNTYTNYYDSSKIGHGYLVSLPPEEKRLVEPIQHATSQDARYRLDENLETIPLLERAVLANQALSDPGVEASEKRAIRAHLKVSETELAAAKPLIDMSAKRPLTLHEFQNAQSVLGFGIKDVLSRDVATRASTLKALYEGEPELLKVHRDLKSERWLEGLARAYGIGDERLVDQVIHLPDTVPADVIKLLRALPEAYVGNPAGVAEVVKATPLHSRPVIFNNIAQGLKTRSITAQALGGRFITGLNSQTAEVREAFLELLHAQSRAGHESPELLALQDIAHRMNHATFEAAEKEWFQDFNVPANQKAELLRIERRRDRAREQSLAAHIPNEQRGEVEEALRKYSMKGLFEELARTDAGVTKTLGQMKPESFEFEPLRLPERGLKFQLGSPEDEEGRYNDEPQRVATLTKPFEIQATPFTQGQIEALLGKGKNPSKFKGDPNRPVEQISWNDVQEVIERLNALDPHYNYRLPTEAEWEVAVRAGTQTRFIFGNSERELADHAWYSSNSGFQTHPVAEKKPNPNGLYDMHGNVWEWMQDAWTSQPTDGIDPVGPPPTSGSSRVFRGGSWNSAAQRARSAFRSSCRPVGRRADLGFRLVRTPK